MKKFLTTMSAVCAFSAAMFAQSPVAKVAADAKADWDIIKSTLTKAADKMSEADYAFKPTPAVRSFGEEVAHAADIQTMLCSTITGSGAKPQQGKTKKADLMAYLNASNAECDKAFSMITDANANEPVRLPWMTRERNLRDDGGLHAAEERGAALEPEVSRARAPRNAADLPGWRRWYGHPATARNERCASSYPSRRCNGRCCLPRGPSAK
jgi:hypothetical protein